jgi:hypothetical protein
MQQTVATLEKERTEQFGSIQQQLKSAIESDEQLRKQTQALSQALTSNNVRGVWGEAQLRKLVELAGLIKHADFDEQATISTNAGAGRADMVACNRLQGSVQRLSRSIGHFRACYRRGSSSSCPPNRRTREGRQGAH